MYSKHLKLFRDVPPAFQQSYFSPSSFLGFHCYSGCRSSCPADSYWLQASYTLLVLANGMQCSPALGASYWLACPQGIPSYWLLDAPRRERLNINVAGGAASPLSPLPPSPPHTHTDAHSHTHTHSHAISPAGMRIPPFLHHTTFRIFTILKAEML